MLDALEETGNWFIIAILILAFVLASSVFMIAFGNYAESVCMNLNTIKNIEYGFHIAISIMFLIPSIILFVFDCYKAIKASK